METTGRRFSPYARKAAKKSRADHQTHHHPTSGSSEPWSPDEDEILRRAVYDLGGKKWKVIATRFPRGTRTAGQCNQRWNDLQNHGTAVKKPWSPSEDARMLELVQLHGAGKWAVIASYLPGRNGKQCRERWHNQLNPDIKKGPWTPEEDAVIVREQAKYGNRWAKIVEKLPGRTDNAVKNHWHSSMKAKVKQKSYEKAQAAAAFRPKRTNAAMARRSTPFSGIPTSCRLTRSSTRSITRGFASSTSFLKELKDEVAIETTPEELEASLSAMDDVAGSPTHMASAAPELNVCVDDHCLPEFVLGGNEQVDAVHPVHTPVKDTVVSFVQDPMDSVVEADALVAMSDDDADVCYGNVFDEAIQNVSRMHDQQDQEDDEEAAMVQENNHVPSSFLALPRHATTSSIQFDRYDEWMKEEEPAEEPALMPPPPGFGEQVIAVPACSAFHGLECDEDVSVDGTPLEMPAYLAQEETHRRFSSSLLHLVTNGAPEDAVTLMNVVERPLYAHNMALDVICGHEDTAPMPPSHEDSIWYVANAFAPSSEFFGSELMC